MIRRRVRARDRGSAAIELVAAVPLLLLLAAVAWYLAAGLAAAMDANERLVPAGLETISGGPAPRTEGVQATSHVPSVAGLPTFEVSARARVRRR